MDPKIPLSILYKSRSEIGVISINVCDNFKIGEIKSSFLSFFGNRFFEISSLVWCSNFPLNLC